LRERPIKDPPYLGVATIKIVHGNLKKPALHSDGERRKLIAIATASPMASPTPQPFDTPTAVPMPTPSAML
jgi:hypothetical protein